MDEALGVVGRLILFGFTTLLVLFLSGVVLKPVMPMGLPPGPDGRMVLTMLVALSVLVAHPVVVLATDGNRWELTGLAADQWKVRWVATGLLAGPLAVFAGAVVLLQLDAVTALPGPVGRAGAFSIDALLTLGTVVALEGLLFRGYLFGLIADRWGTPIAATISTGAFALYHTSVPGATVGAFVGALALGAFLAMLRWRGGLIAATLAHLAAGVMQGVVLRLPVGGLELGIPPRWRLEASGPEWLSGGAWGIDGGAAVTLSLVVVTFLLLRVPRSPYQTPHR